MIMQQISKHAVMVVLALLLTSNPLRAGLYRSSGPPLGPSVDGDTVKPLSFSHFRDVFGTVMQLGIEKPEGPERKRYLAERDALRAKARSGKLGTDDAVNLGETLIRLRQYDEAVEILTPVAAQDRRNFMAIANLATAHQLAGRPDRAISYLQQALDSWPEEWPGLTKQQLRWLRRAESFHLRLLKLRYREAAGQGGRGKKIENVDNLFGKDGAPVRFVGEQGQYEPGKLASQERSKLEPDSLAIVQQLLLWLPEDTRLYWLMGELYNAQGDIDAAAIIFEDCVWNRRFDAAELREHRKVVLEARPKSQPLDLIAEVPESTPASPKSANDPAASSNFLPGGRQIAMVAGAAGLLVLALAYFQIREVRKRKKKPGE